MFTAPVECHASTCPNQMPARMQRGSRSSFQNALELLALPRAPCQPLSRQCRPQQLDTIPIDRQEKIIVVIGPRGDHSFFSRTKELDVYGLGTHKRTEPRKTLPCQMKRIAYREHETKTCFCFSGGRAAHRQLDQCFFRRLPACLVPRCCATGHKLGMDMDMDTYEYGG